MYNKIVDMVAVTSRTKPLNGGKCERWWRENSTGRHGLDKKQYNRSVSGRAIPGAMSPSVEETLTRFKFKGFEFGNWLSQAERYDVFRTFQFCLADMQHWLGSTNLGLDHQIAVAFGARGSKGALAHYEPVINVINMTKKKGAGSLLHEYAHAIDYTIGGFVPEEQNKLFTALSGGHTITQFKNNVGCQFRAMMNKILRYARSTESYKRLEKATKNISYWGNSTEMFARITEAYYAYYHNKNNNHYLVKPVSVYEERSKSAGIYLSKAEMDVIKPELDKFWKEVGLLLNDKCKLVATPFPASEKKVAEPKDPIKKESQSKPKKDSKKKEYNALYQIMQTTKSVGNQSGKSKTITKVYPDTKIPLSMKKIERIWEEIKDGQDPAKDKKRTLDKETKTKLVYTTKLVPFTLTTTFEIVKADKKTGIVQQPIQF